MAEVTIEEINVAEINKRTQNVKTGDGRSRRAALDVPRRDHNENGYLRPFPLLHPSLINVLCDTGVAAWRSQAADNRRFL